jgi:hypothetical protein
MESEDPTVVRSLAVHADDVVQALETNARADGEVEAILRVTPPFSGRMRARLHLAGREGEYGDPEPIHVAPERFVADPPAFPVPGEAATAGPDAEPAVEAWREAVREALRERVTLDTPAGEHAVDVRYLGRGGKN